MRMTKVTLELSDSDWICILDALIERRDNLVDTLPLESDSEWILRGIEQTNLLISLIHGRIAD